MDTAVMSGRVLRVALITESQLGDSLTWSAVMMSSVFWQIEFVYFLPHHLRLLFSSKFDIKIMNSKHSLGQMSAEKEREVEAKIIWERKEDATSVAKEDTSKEIVERDHTVDQGHLLIQAEVAQKIEEDTERAAEEEIGEEAEAEAIAWAAKVQEAEVIEEKSVQEETVKREESQSPTQDLARNQDQIAQEDQSQDHHQRIEDLQTKNLKIERCHLKENQLKELCLQKRNPPHKLMDNLLSNKLMLRKWNNESLN